MARALVPRVALLLALASAVTLALAGLGYRWGWWGVATSFSVLRAASIAAIGVALLALVGVALTALARAWPALALAVVALVIAAAVLWFPLSLQKLARTVPFIHDITTDTDNPPVFVAVVAVRRDAPNPAAYDGPDVAAQQKQGYPDLAPLTLTAAPDRTIAAAEATARAMGWQIVAVAPAEGRLEATATTRWFGFKDDVVVRVVPAGTGSRVDVRSKSRVGQSDLGANAMRIRAFLTALQTRVT
jgi:uncharacterized protein (DUF1499 family)